MGIDQWPIGIWFPFPPRYVIGPMVNCHMSYKKKKDAQASVLLGGGRGTLALRSRPECGLVRLSSGFCRQLVNSGSDLLAVLLTVLNRDASTSSQITVTLCLRVQRKARLLLLAANFPGNHQSVRINRSDRTLGEMRRRMGCFRLGIGGRVRIRFGVLAGKSSSKERQAQTGNQNESLKIESHSDSLVARHHRYKL